MTNWGIKEKSVKWEYAHGLTEIQICERLNVSQIWLYHALCALRADYPNLESRHLKACRGRGYRFAKARIVANNDHWDSLRVAT